MDIVLALYLLGSALDTLLKPSVKFYCQHVPLPLLSGGGGGGGWRGVQAYLFCSYYFVFQGLAWVERGMGTLFISISGL